MKTVTTVTSDDESRKINHANFASQINLLTESHLCFNKDQFNRADFNVERFLNLARRRASLEQIHNDLRIYLKIVQNSMIELINDDYADFVNLSSNLVGLKETIDKLTKNIETIWYDFCSNTQIIKESAEFVEQKTTDLIACRKAQYEIHGQIFLIKSIEKLADKIACCPEAIEQFWLENFADAVVNVILWFGKVNNIDDKVAAAYTICLTHVRKLTEYWLVQDLKGDCCFIEQILGIITLNNSADSAVSCVMTEIIDEHIGEPRSNLEDFLNEVYGTVRKLREDWSQKLRIMACRPQIFHRFWTNYFGSVVVPSDNRVFHRCYKRTCEFISNWPGAANSRTVLRMIQRIWSDEVYLPTLLDKFWDFTLKVLARYLEWIEGIKSYYWTHKRAPEDFEIWRLFCSLHADCVNVDNRTFEIALSSIWPKIREHKLDVTMFGQCLSIFSTKIAERTQEFEKLIIEDAVTSLTEILDGVCGIPRQYRWTKKPAPTEVSQYVSETSAMLKLFRDEMDRCCWNEENITSVYKKIFAESLEIFSTKAKQVLKSVEQTERSLQRFKRKSLAINESNVDSDENKIRRQLLLDLDYFKALAASCHIEMSHIEALMLRANPLVETIQIPGPAQAVSNTVHSMEEA
ncbi:Conserved oligomeric Golgi complex subunit 2 [Dirofilaria immitis]|nr:Conserved oligomeric Golgi complex subunit 2 [Dirofilaria immitis]